MGHFSLPATAERARPDIKGASSAERVRLNHLAVEIAKRSGKTSTIQALTGVSTETARTLFSDTNGCRPPPGGGIDSCFSLLKTGAMMHVQVSVFGAIFCSVEMENDNKDRLLAERFLEAYEEYTANMVDDVISPRGLSERLRTGSDNMALNINDAAIVARDLSLGNAILQDCGKCGMIFLAPTETMVGQLLSQHRSINVRHVNEMTKCPVCRLAEAAHPPAT